MPLLELDPSEKAFSVLSPSQEKESKHEFANEAETAIFRNTEGGYSARTPVGGASGLRGVRHARVVSTVFYRWQKAFFENGHVAFERQGADPVIRKSAKKIDRLERKLQQKDTTVRAEPMAEYIAAKKPLGKTDWSLGRIAQAGCCG